MRAVTRGKPLLLWKKLFLDMDVCKYMEEGVHLTGPEDHSPLYMTKYAPTTLTVDQLYMTKYAPAALAVEQLDHQATWKRKALMGKATTEEEIEPSEGWRLSTTSPLPFGASSAVFSFNKISRGLWHVLA